MFSLRSFHQRGMSRARRPNEDGMGVAMRARRCRSSSLIGVDQRIEVKGRQMGHLLFPLHQDNVRRVKARQRNFERIRSGKRRQRDGKVRSNRG